MQNTGILMFMFVIWDKKLLLTEPSHLRATCQGVEEVKKHKTGKSHRCGSRSYASFWILEAHKNSGVSLTLQKYANSIEELNVPCNEASQIQG